MPNKYNTKAVPSWSPARGNYQSTKTPILSWSHNSHIITIVFLHYSSEAYKMACKDELVE